MLIVGTTAYATSFDEGIKAFNERDYEKAQALFEAVIEKTPQDASGYYNLGLTHQELKHYGKAIWAYEKTLKYTPNDSEAKKNLAYCHTALGSSQEYTPYLNRMESAMYSINTDTWAILAIVASLLLATCLIAFARSKQVSSRKLYLILGFLFTLVLVVSTFTAKASNAYVQESNYGIITQDSILVYSAEKPDMSIGSLPEGMRVYKKEELDQRTSVESANGETYIVNTVDVEFI